MIIHGDHDPVFPIGHAYGLQKTIKHAKLAIILGMGHGVLNANLYQPIINKIDETARQTQ